MSNQQPSSSRRRIAGERRTPTPTPTPSAATAPPATRTPTAASSGTSSPDADGGTSRGRVSVLKRREARPAPVATDSPPSRPRRAVAGGRRLVVALAVLLALLLLYTGLMLLGLLGTDGVADVERAETEASAGRAAQSSAERAAEAVLAYDYRTLEEDRDAATRFMTSEYAKDYVGTFDTAVIDVATEAKAVVTVEVQGSAVLTTSSDAVRVLLFVDQTTQSRQGPDAAQPQLALNRVELQMVRQDDSWLVADVLSF